MLHSKPLVTSYYLVLASLIVFQIAHVLLSNNSQVSTSITLKELQSTLTHLEDEKKELVNQLAEVNSLTQLKEEASQEGYVPLSQPIVVHSDSTVAQSGL